MHYLENIEYLVFINKVDDVRVQNKLEEMKEVRKYCDENKFLIYETSAKRNLNINEAVYDLANKIYDQTSKINGKIKGITRTIDLYEDIDISIMESPKEIKESIRCNDCIIS